MPPECKGAPLARGEGECHKDAVNPQGAERLPTEGARFELGKEGDAILVEVAGRWQLEGELPSPEDVEKEIERTKPVRVVFEGSRVAEWDTSLLAFLFRLSERCRELGVETDRSRLPAGLRRLLELAEAVPEAEEARREEAPRSFLARVGEATEAALGEAAEFLSFVGEVTLALVALARGRARCRLSDFLLMVQRCGADALPIVTVISFLVGLILAFVGAIQLQQFGASIYVADLVGIAMVREMGAMMTGIVMAGRTGAAFAAELGTMKVTQEVDALRTTGISPTEFLVLPRLLALFFMMPLLCVYSDFVGVLGGAAVGVSMLGLSWTTYYTQTTAAVTLGHLFGGILKAATYGALVAVAGCLRGMQCGRSSAAVGEAATSAVVTSIVLIIGACGVYAVVFYILGI
ncbi:MAG: ABC transporter permease [Candidatus Binatia bacterium]|nr:MAG: ABC transporter permease [Candidatus Binatia bacterium]